MKVEGFPQKVLVNAADPLAEPPMSLYYVHIKMPMYKLQYNNKFFLFWDQVIAEGFARTIPWFPVESPVSS